jgi:hypothetical protein
VSFVQTLADRIGWLTAKLIKTWVRCTMTTETIEKHLLIRLETAAKIAFPDGSVTVSLRKQIKLGRLIAWLVGGKYLTSLNEIERMLEKCRVTPSRPDSGTVSQGGQNKVAVPKKASGSSFTTDANLARDAAKGDRPGAERALAEFILKTAVGVGWSADCLAFSTSGCGSAGREAWGRTQRNYPLPFFRAQILRNYPQF